MTLLRLWRSGCQLSKYKALSLELVNVSIFILSRQCGPILSYVTSRWLVVLAASLARYLEAEDLWFIVVHLWRQDDSVLIVLNKVMREARSEESAINIYGLEFGNIDLAAPWAILLKSGLFWSVTHTYRQYFLSITKSSRT